MIATRTNSPVEYVPTSDAALDTDSPEFSFQNYLKSFDRKHLPVKPGRTPTVFSLRRLNRRRFTGIAGMPKHEQAEAAIAYGVVNMSGFQDGRGNEIRPEFEGAGADSRLTNKTLDDIFSPTLFAELSQVIILLSELDPLADARSVSSPG